LAETLGNAGWLGEGMPTIAPGGKMQGGGAVVFKREKKGARHGDAAKLAAISGNFQAVI
jgi:hypothetical protein